MTNQPKFQPVVILFVDHDNGNSEPLGVFATQADAEFFSQGYAQFKNARVYFRSIESVFFPDLGASIKSVVPDAECDCPACQMEREMLTTATEKSTKH